MRLAGQVANGLAYKKYEFWKGYEPTPLARVRWVTNCRFSHEDDLKTQLSHSPEWSSIKHRSHLFSLDYKFRLGLWKRNPALICASSSLTKGLSQEFDVIGKSQLPPMLNFQM